jgi:enediyne biosynthesis protein E4
MVQAARSDAMPKERRTYRRRAALGVVALVLLAAAVVVLQLRQRSFQAELQQAREALIEGRYGLARQRLERLAQRWTNDGEILFLLGNSELLRGKREAAMAAWARVPASSSFFGKAALAMATRLADAGRYSPAEAILLEALADPTRDERLDLERELVLLYSQQGRFDDVRRITRGFWYRALYPAAVLRDLWAYDFGPKPVGPLKNSLSNADQDDDRVWLGWANHAILTGRYDDASSWLKKCLGRRPDDPAVRQSQLELALATGDIDSFWTAAQHLPGDCFDEPKVLGYRAWLAARNGDSELEQRELVSLVNHGPHSGKDLERLATLKFQSGRLSEAQDLRRRKAEFDRIYDTAPGKFTEPHDLAGQADELAELSSKLGRTFDAEAWSILAETRRRDPGSLQPGDPSRTSSPIPAFLRDRAASLSAPYMVHAYPVAKADSSLSDRLADLRLGTAARHEKATASGADRKDNEPTRTVPLFADDAERAGLLFQHDSGRTARRLLPETMSGGVAVLDFDGDGWYDVYCVQGGSLTASPGRGTVPPPAGDRLFRNRRDGTFEDVTEKSGIASLAWGQGYGLGVAVGDYDNDGKPDLFVSRLMTYALYRNRGDGTFEDVTGKVGLAGRRDYPSSSAFADLDNDGDLDLYVCHYMLWDPVRPASCQDDNGNSFYCPPTKVPPAPDHVFRNDSGQFVDVTAESGCTDVEGHGLGVIAADLDGDQRIDLFVANDLSRNYLYHNRGGFRFEEIALQAGVAAGAQGGYQAGMGVACGDLDGDGRPDLVVTNFYGEGTSHFRNLGDNLFTDQSAASGIGPATRYLLGFGIVMDDVTNHGRLDVMITNGHVYDNRPTYAYAMPCRLYENRPDGRLVDVSGQVGECWKVERVGRGLAAGDLDNDGRIDAMILAENGPVAFFHNQTKSVGHFVTFRLEGTKSNRDGVGSSVTLMAGGRKQVAQRCGGSSYQSANDPRLHFGLAKTDRVDSVEVHWPSGRVDIYTGLVADTGYLLREGEPGVLPLPGFSPRGADPKGH